MCQQLVALVSGACCQLPVPYADMSTCVCLPASASASLTLPACQSRVFCRANVGAVQPHLTVVPQMVNVTPLVKVNVVKKRTAKFRRFQSNRFMRVPVR